MKYAAYVLGGSNDPDGVGVLKAPVVLFNDIWRALTEIFVTMPSFENVVSGIGNQTLDGALAI
jgi:hypothetical protein